MKEYLEKQANGYVLVKDTCKRSEDWIEVPDGAEMYVYFNELDNHYFYKDGFSAIWQDDGYWDNDMSDYIKYCKKDGTILWQRPQQPESLPFIDDEVQSINDQYAEIEQVRQDMINHPSHYTQGKVECIDALESATIGKSGIEAVCVANIIKYLWRYEEKNGIEDVKKAQFYLNRLLATLENNNG